VLRTCSNIALIGKSQNGGQANLKTCENRCFPETASICFKSIQVKYVDFQIPLPVARPSQWRFPVWICSTLDPGRSSMGHPVPRKLPHSAAWNPQP
jgi:hypothetical protein